MAIQKISLRRKGATFALGDTLYPVTDYNYLINKPNTFTPTAHRHNWSDIDVTKSDVQNVLTGAITFPGTSLSLNSKAVALQEWVEAKGYQKNSDITKAEIETKLTGTISTHNHDGAYLKSLTGAVLMTGNQTNIAGNKEFTGLTSFNRAMSSGSAAFTNPHLALKANTNTDTTGFTGMSFATSASTNYGFTLGAQRTSSGYGNLILRGHFNNAAGTEIFRVSNQTNDILFNSDVNIASGKKYKINGVNLTYTDVGAAASSHNHDDRYFTETEINSMVVKLTGDQTISGIKTINSSDLRMNGGSVAYLRPATTGGWSRGFWWQKNASDDVPYERIGGIGVLGSNQNVSKFYIGYGDSPWSGSALEVYPNYTNAKGLKVNNIDVIVEGDSRLTNARPASDVYAWAKTANATAIPVTKGGTGLISMTNEYYYRYNSSLGTMQGRSAANVRSDIGANNAANINTGRLPASQLPVNGVTATVSGSTMTITRYPA